MRVWWKGGRREERGGAVWVWCVWYVWCVQCAMCACGRVGGRGGAEAKAILGDGGLVLHGREGASGHVLYWRVQHVHRFWVLSRRWQDGGFSLPRVMCLCMTLNFIQKKHS